MLRAVIHSQGSTWLITSAPPAGDDAATPVAISEDHSGDGHCTVETCSTDPGPILPEMKELAWGAGAFIVLAVLMRWFIYPKLKAGTDARYRSIREGHSSAEAVRSAARAEVAEYEAEIAKVRAEATAIVDAARNEVEAQRQSELGALNARVAQQRAAAAAEAEAARAAVSGQIADAVGQVASRASQLVTGHEPTAEVVDRVVSEVMAR